jgi:hypothetical protein
MNSDLFVTTEDWAQAASEAAASATANSLMEDMLHPRATEIRQVTRRDRIAAEPWPDETKHGIHHAISLWV